MFVDSRNSKDFKCDLSQVESIDACMEDIFKSKRSSFINEHDKKDNKLYIEDESATVIPFLKRCR